LGERGPGRRSTARGVMALGAPVFVQPVAARGGASLTGGRSHGVETPKSQTHDTQYDGHACGAEAGCQGGAGPSGAAR
jgi:hypothetical protein